MAKREPMPQKPKTLENLIEEIMEKYNQLLKEYPALNPKRPKAIKDFLRQSLIRVAQETVRVGEIKNYSERYEYIIEQLSQKERDRYMGLIDMIVQDAWWSGREKTINNLKQFLGKHYSEDT